MRRIPPLSAVRVFEAAARHLNFTAAGAELGMTQAAVSYQIRLIEERLGVPLFRREKKRVVLTEAGRKAAPLVSGAFDKLDEAFAVVRAEDEAVLTISAGSSFASNWIAPRLGGFQVAHPEMAVRVLTSNHLVDFAHEEVDVAVRSGVGPWRGLTRHFLFRQHFTPMCSPAFRARHSDLRAPADLLDVALISPHDPWWRLWLEMMGVEAPGLPSRPGIRLDSQGNEGQAAMADQGVAMLTPLFWPREIAEGRLVQLFPGCGFDGTSYWLVHPEHRAGVLKIRRFRDWIAAEAARQATTDRCGAFAPPDA